MCLWFLRGNAKTPNVEYADVLGIPFDFTAKPVVSPPQRPRQTVQVRAVRPERDALEIRFPRVQGYRIDLPNDRLTAEFTAESVLELTPELIGATETRVEGIVGQSVDLNLAHTADVRQSTISYELTSQLLNHWRGAGEELPSHLFNQFRRIAREWLDGGYLVCKGDTYPAQLRYKMLADMACERIVAAIMRAERGENRVVALLDAYNPTGSTHYVNFTTTNTRRWQTDARRCPINWVVLDSDWEAEFCRVAEAHPRVRSYVKNHSLGFEIPYQDAGVPRRYRPDFIVQIDDGQADPLHLVVEIKGIRDDESKTKRQTVETLWLPGVNALGTHGRWAFVELSDLYQINAEFRAVVAGLLR